MKYISLKDEEEAVPVCVRRLHPEVIKHGGSRNCPNKNLLNIGFLNPAMPDLY